MSDEYNDENSLFILDNCREEGLTIQRHAFTTPFAYEIDFNYNYESIWAMTSYNEQYSPHNFIKAETTFNAFCEFYYCWIGEEDDAIEGRIEFNLNDVVEQRVYINEKCYIKFINQ